MPASLMFACVGGVISGLFHISILMGGLGAVILMYMSTLPLLLVGLGLGFRPVVIAGAIGSGLTTVIAGEWLGLSYLALNAVPVVLLVRQALLARQSAVPARQTGNTADQTSPTGNAIEWYPPGLLLCWLAGLGGLAILAAVLLAARQDGGLQGLIISVLVTMLRGTVAMAEGPAMEAAATVAPMIPGMVAISWLLMVIGNAILAQGALLRFHRNLRPSMRIADVVLPPWLTVALVIAIVVAVLADGAPRFVAVNIAIVAALPIFFGGLAVVHALAERIPARAVVLGAFYVVLMLFGWPALIVVGLGIIEQWVGLRRRFIRTGPDQEEV
ncbi:MAG: DUF2232 domain-containing protein [Azospirillaceae bacterium]|nr:DUF2232 domain-containing protein [Azospirillaceae bacterium]